MRIPAGVLAIALLVGLLAGGVAQAGQAASVVPSEPITIEVWWHEYGPFTAYVKELIEAYKKVRPNVTVNPTVASSTDLNQKLTVSLAAGTGPDIMDADA
jgi:ABC-type glycerol-3-phosphate transport system substrate-binding protein